MLFREIIVTDNDAVLDSILVVALSESSLTIRLEEEFFRICRDYDDNFEDNEYEQEEIASFFIDGLYEFDRGLITIREPLVIDADEE